MPTFDFMVKYAIFYKILSYKSSLHRVLTKDTPHPTNMKPLLSICIPTYKRPAYLGKCLESLCVQLANNPELNARVEIVISDNCSQDNTGNVVERYKKDFKNIQYLINKENVGFDLNVYNLIKNATGEYCWYLGDDDVITNGGIDFVCKQLETGRYDYIGVESEPLSPESNYADERKLSKESLIEINNFNDCYFNNYFQGAVSVLIFNRELWMQSVTLNDFLEHWLYYETVAKILVATKKKMLYITNPIIFTGQDCRWAENGTEIFTYINSNILREKMIGFGFNKKRLSEELTKNRKRLLLILLRAKGHRLECNFKNLKFIYEYSGNGFAYLSVATLIYFLPNKLVVLTRNTRKAFLK